MTVHSQMRIVLAPNAFKGSLTAAQVAAHLSVGIRRAAPEPDVVVAPVADGGDGTLDAALAAGFTRVPVTAHGPTGLPLESAIALRDGVAVVELAAVSGLALLPGGRPDPLHASTFGVGELILAALDAGCREVVLGVGGSASTDGGAGLLQALGVRLQADDGTDLPLGGIALAGLASIDVSGLDSRLADVRVVLASDVDNPLTGPAGAAAVYGPQKGATPADVSVLDAALTHFAELLDPAAGTRPGAGAAGGTGFAALAVLGATMRPGIDVVLELAGFDQLLRGADLVVTGEGMIDTQTLRGKAPAGVARAARAAGVRCVAVCGQNQLTDAALAEAGISRVHALTDVEPNIHLCLAAPGPLLERLGELLANELAG